MKIQYVSEDGKVFKDEKSCLKYEKEIIAKHKHLESLQKQIDDNMKELDYLFEEYIKVSNCAEKYKGINVISPLFGRYTIYFN